MNDMRVMFEFAKDRQSEMVREAALAHQLEQAYPSPRRQNLRRLLVALAVMSLAAAVTVQKVSAAVGGAGGGGRSVFY